MRDKYSLEKGSVIFFVLNGLLLAACAGQGAISATPSPDVTPTPTLSAIVYEPTNPEGYNLPITLSNVVLQCTAPETWLLEFEYLPVTTHFDIVDDPLNPKSSLTCTYRTAGHGTCAGFIDFTTSLVVSLRLCQGKDSATWVCISQTLQPAQCPAKSTP